MTLCAGRLDVDWFSDDEAEQQRAAALCRRCSARQGCEEGARARGEGWGIWGAHNAAQGFLEVEASPVEFMVVEDKPVAHLRVSIPAACGSRGKYNAGCHCEPCTEANRRYKAKHDENDENGPVTPRPIVVDNRIPLFEGVA